MSSKQDGSPEDTMEKVYKMMEQSFLEGYQQQQQQSGGAVGVAR